MKPLRTRAFSLIELLVALGVFAALAAAAYGGLSAISRTRGLLAERQDRFAAVVRAVTMLERDLRQATSRPVRGNARGEELPALTGAADRIEMTRLGFANPRAEPRSNLERVAYAVSARRLVRARFAVLDRAPDSVPATTTLLADTTGLRFRYLGADGIWRDAWPPADSPSGSPATSMLLPRAVEFRLDVADAGELRRIVELSTAIPTVATGRFAGRGRTPPSTPNGGGAVRNP